MNPYSPSSNYIISKKRPHSNCDSWDAELIGQKTLVTKFLARGVVEYIKSLETRAIIQFVSSEL